MGMQLSGQELLLPGSVNEIQAVQLAIICSVLHSRLVELDCYSPLPFQIHAIHVLCLQMPRLLVSIGKSFSLQASFDPLKLTGV